MQWVGRIWAKLNDPDVRQMWWHPPQPPGPLSQSTPPVESYFLKCLFLWAPRKMWKCYLRCPVRTCGGELVSKAMYNKLRKVIDIKNQYYLASENYQCNLCKKCIIANDSRVVEQLPLDLRSRFPAVLTHKFACDKSVVALMRSRTMGNSPTALCHTISEEHSTEWMTRSVSYLSDCKRRNDGKKALGLAISQPNEMPPFRLLPTPRWFLAVYIRDVHSRLEMLKASATSIYGLILKIDSTKKVLI